MKIGTVQLSQANKDILLHPRAWLNDNIIHAAQVLLKSQAPMVGGLQEPGKGHVCSFDIEQGEFVQILHDGHGHWLMVSTVGAKNGEVHVYDSMYPSVGYPRDGRVLPVQGMVSCSLHSSIESCLVL